MNRPSAIPDMNHILVLCEGNICRSPMAAALLQAALGPLVQVDSAGLQAPHNFPADPEAQRLMAARGLDLAAHRSRQFTDHMGLSADLILVMDQEQLAACHKQLPSVRGRVFLLGQWLPPGTPKEIADPFRKGKKPFFKAYEHIDQAVQGWLPRLLHGKKQP